MVEHYGSASGWMESASAVSNKRKIMTKQSDFNTAYWASKPPDVRALNTMDPDVPRMDAAYALAIKGFIIDKEIDGWGLDPFIRMSQRIADGYTWVPNALQAPVQVAPGLMVPAASGLVQYDPAHPPAGSIKCSLSLADYPPFDPPKPPSPPDPNSILSPVGMQLHDIYYAEQPWDHWLEGSVTGVGVPPVVPADPRGTFVKQFVVSLFGKTGWWMLKKP